MVGHSLGGALSSLVGITFGLPTVTFESPGERLAATRLHLPSPVCVFLPPLKLFLLIITFLALYPPCHTYLSHSRPHRDGYMQWHSFFLCTGWIRDGDSVSFLPAVPEWMIYLTLGRSLQMSSWKIDYL